MKIKNFKNCAGSLVAIFFGLSVVFFGTVVNAQAQGAQTEYQQCGGDNPASSVLKLPKGQYDIYAKLGQKDTTEQAALYTEKLDSTGLPGNCKKIASGTVSDKKYTKLATANFDDEINIIYFASVSATSMQTASAPQIIMFPTGTAICDMQADCLVTYQAQPMTLSPKKISLSSDSLRVGLLSLLDPNDAIKKVIYSIDGKPVYESEKLEPFNEKYVSGGEHTLGRRVVFASGASLSDSKLIERGTIADLFFVVQSILFSNSKILRIVFGFLGVLVLLELFKFVVRQIYKRRVWKQNHIATASGYSINSAKTGAQKNFYDESVGRTLYRYRRWFIWLLGIAFGAVICISYIIGVFTVDGVSMYPTLQDTSVHPLIKINKTIATINRSQYVPKRGDIVVVIKDENNLFDPTVTVQKSYVVKRVVGLPGERITVKNGLIKVYNKEFTDGFVPDDKYKWITDTTGSEFFNIDITLKDSELFVVGDNRDESIDSRFYGPIDTKEVIGKVIP